MSEKILEISLKKIIEADPHSLKGFVASEIIEHDNIRGFFEDLSQHGCISGLVGSLIYYRQTHQFFDDHFDEINELRCRFEEQMGQPMNLGHDLKNNLAWFAFEQTAFDLASELEVL
jgi:hypothetical protein